MTSDQMVSVSLTWWGTSEKTRTYLLNLANARPTVERSCEAVFTLATRGRFLDVGVKIYH